MGVCLFHCVSHRERLECVKNTLTSECHLERSLKRSALVTYTSKVTVDPNHRETVSSIWMQWGIHSKIHMKLNTFIN